MERLQVIILIIFCIFHSFPLLLRKIKSNKEKMTIESHPLEPFLPENTRILFLGSFPPPRARWSMDFFYPNWINDFWRLMGLIHFEDKTYFEIKGEKRFDREKIIAFAEEKGLAFYDTATKVRRLKDNASDNFLEILEPTDIGLLLSRMPHCNTIVTTGGKASEQVQAYFASKGINITIPPVGEKVEIRPFSIFNSQFSIFNFYRMPSSSRAYPLALEKKAEFYRKLF